MAAGSNNLNVLIQGILDEKSTRVTINAQLKRITKQLDPLKIRIDIDLSTIKKLTDQVSKLNSSLKGAQKLTLVDTKAAEKELDVFKKVYEDAINHVRTSLNGINTRKLETSLRNTGLGIQTLTTLMNTYRGSVIAARIATAAFQATLTMGLSLVITGITSLITHFTNKQKEAAEAQQEFIQSTKQVYDSFIADNSKLNQLLKHYDALSQKTILSIEEQEELNQVRKEMSDILPGMVKYFDAEGNAVYAASEEVKELVRNYRELNKEREEIVKADLLENTKKDSKALKKTLKKVSDYEDAYKQRAAEAEALKFMESFVIDNNLPEINSDTEYEEKLEELRDKVKKIFDNHEVHMNEMFFNNNLTPPAEMTEIRINAEIKAGKAKSDLEAAKSDISESITSFIELFKITNHEILDLAHEQDENITLFFNEFAKNFAENNIDSLAKDQAGTIKIYEDYIDQINELINNNKIDLSNLYDVSNLENIKAVFEAEGIPVQEINVLLERANRHFQEQSKTIKILKIDHDKLTEAYEKEKSELESLNQAITDVSNGQNLTGETVAGLLLKYPQLSSAIEKSVNGYTIEKTALEKVREAHIDLLEAKLKAEAGMTQTSYEELSKRLAVYGIELAMIKSLDDANTKMVEAKKKYRNHKILGDDDDRLHNEFMKGLTDSEENLREYALFVERLRFMLDGLSTSNNNISYSNGSPASSYSDLPQQEDLTKELILSFSSDYFKRLKSINELTEQITNAEKQKNYNQEIELTNQLLEQQRLAIDDLTAANMNIHQQANSIRAGHPNYDTDSWFDINGEATLAYKELLNSLSTGTAQEEVKNLFNQLYQLKHAWRDNVTLMKELSNSAEDTLGKIAEAVYKNIELQLEKTSKEVKKFDDLLATSKDRLSLLKEGSAEYTNELANQAQVLQDKLAAEMAHEENIRKQMETVDLTEEKWNELNQKLKESILAQMGVATAIQSTNRSLRDQIDKLGNEIVAIYKEMYGKQKEAAQAAHKEKIKLLDEEMKKYEDIIKLKLKALDEQWDEEDYDRQLAKMQKERDAIQKQIDTLAINHSLEAKARRADLEKQLAEKNEEIEDYERNYSREQQKKNLEDLLEEKKNRVDAEKDELDRRQEQHDKYYDELINNERKFNKIKEDLSKGSTEQIKKDLEGFRNFAESSYSLIGTSISENLVDRINLAVDNLEAIKPSILSNISVIGESLKDKILAVLDQIIDKFKQLGDLNYSDSPAGQLKNEQEIIAQMKANSKKWASAKTQEERDILYNENQRLGKSIGATYHSPSGKWFDKNGIPLFESGGYTGNFKGVRLAGLHEKELVLNKMDTSNMLRTVDIVRGIIDKIKSPFDFNRIIPSLTNKPTSPVVNPVYIHIENITGDRKGGEDAVNVIMKSLNAQGVRLNF